jgi:hypothetical protein
MSLLRSIITGSLISISIASCATKPIPVIYQCPKIVLPTIPVMQIKNLNKTSKPDQVAKAFASDLVACKAWITAVQQQTA